MTGGTWQLAAGLLARGYKLPAGALRPVVAGPTGGPVQQLSFGTDAGLADLFVLQYRTLAAGANEVLDLYGGTVLDVFGDAAAFRKLKSVLVWVSSGGDSSGVTVGNASPNGHPLFLGAAAHTSVIYPDGPGYVGGSPAGVAVTTTSRNVKVANNGAAAVTYAVALAGGSV